MEDFCPDQTGVWGFGERSSIAGIGAPRGGSPFIIKKHKRGYLLNVFGGHVSIRESFPVGTRGVYYLDYSTTDDNLLEVNFVPVVKNKFQSVNRRVSNQGASNQTTILPNIKYIE
ncbi:unnamed protein product [Microthlaspi erraticum]|uniref:Uncharacterized protein n=1 Tax=Microthlaspi erraticum TaxID=1685480 RepID=A0A6D2KX18_9BRAS|nr:unnamed protein product [Microthlaspi erraticum]